MEPTGRSSSGSDSAQGRGASRPWSARCRRRDTVSPLSAGGKSTITSSSKRVRVAHRDERPVAQAERSATEIEDPTGRRQQLHELAAAHVQRRRKLGDSARRIATPTRRSASRRSRTARSCRSAEVADNVRRPLGVAGGGGSCRNEMERLLGRQLGEAPGGVRWRDGRRHRPEPAGPVAAASDDGRGGADRPGAAEAYADLRLAETLCRSQRLLPCTGLQFQGLPLTRRCLVRRPGLSPGTQAPELRSRL